MPAELISFLQFIRQEQFELQNILNLCLTPIPANRIASKMCWQVEQAVINKHLEIHLPISYCGIYLREKCPPTLIEQIIHFTQFHVIFHLFPTFSVSLVIRKLPFYWSSLMNRILCRINDSSQMENNTFIFH